MSPFAAIVDVCTAAVPRRASAEEFEANVAWLRRLSGALQAGDADAARMGVALMTWLQHGGDLVELLGVKPAPGSTTNAQALVLRDRQDAALLRLQRLAGSDSKAVAMLRGERCAGRAAEALHEALELGVPASRAAITRARARLASRAQAGGEASSALRHQQRNRDTE